MPWVNLDDNPVLALAEYKRAKKPSYPKYDPYEFEFFIHTLTPVNQAAKAFTRKYLLNDEGLFCFSKLIPIPDFINYVSLTPEIVTQAELQKIKSENPELVDTLIDEGLLYSKFHDDSKEDHRLTYCTKEFLQSLKKKYGVTSWYD